MGRHDVPGQLVRRSPGKGSSLGIYIGSTTLPPLGLGRSKRADWDIPVSSARYDAITLQHDRLFSEEPAIPDILLFTKEVGAGNQIVWYLRTSLRTVVSSRKESVTIRDTKDQTIALNVSLKPSESSAHPRATNYTNVGVAQGVAYLDFGFIEPALLAAIAKAAKDGQAAPKGLDGTLVIRVAMGVDVLARLHQQIQHVLVNMRDTRQPKQKT